MEVLRTSRVTKFIDSLDSQSRAKVLKLINFLQKFANLLGMPHSKHIDINLYELRARGQQEIRIFYTFRSNQAILLHGFIKKSQKTPIGEINQARKIKNQLDI